MNKFIKITTIAAMLFSIGIVSFADRGIGKKSKAKTLLNINSTSRSSLRNSIVLNVKDGLMFKGSFFNNRLLSSSSMMNASLMTYQKGNTTYIIPYKQKIAVSEMRQGYTGIKFIIRK